MEDVVLVSSWRRADYLKLVFDSLLNARGIEDKQVWVFQNNRYDKGIDLEPVHRVLKYYSKLFPSFQITNQTFWDRNVPGWWYSQKEALESVHRANASRMFFFSDDTVCTPDFFEWHDAVNENQDWFASTAWRPAAGNDKPFDLEAYYLMSFPNEISMGFCINHENLGYMLESGTGWPSQDYMIEKQWKIAMPYVQRIFHVGGFSSHLESVGENTGPAVDKMPNPIPDYGPQKAILKD